MPKPFHNGKSHTSSSLNAVGLNGLSTLSVSPSPGGFVRQISKDSRTGSHGRHPSSPGRSPSPGRGPRSPRSNGAALAPDSGSPAFGAVCLSRCFSQIVAAESALAEARAALSQHADPQGTATSSWTHEVEKQWQPPQAPPSPVQPPQAHLANLVPCLHLPKPPPEPPGKSPLASVDNTSSPKFLTVDRHGPSAGWKTLDPGSMKIAPVAFDQAIVGCIGAPANTSPGGNSTDPASMQLRSAPLVTPSAMEQKRHGCIEILWEPILCGSFFLPMLHPETKVCFIWMIIGLCFIVYEAYAIPVYLAFDVTPSGFLLVVVSLVNLYFIMDIIFQFLCCQLDQGGELVKAPKAIASNYFRSWFVPDIISAIPWEWIVSDDSTALKKLTRSVRFIRAFRMFRLVRLIRIMKLRSIMERFEQHVESNTLLTFVSGVVRIMLLVFAILHWSACIWYAIGTAEYDQEHIENSPASWVRYHQEDYPFIGEDKGDHYIYALYFSLTTMTTVGYGDITPTNFNEVCFAMFLLFISSMVFAGLMGTLTDMISALNSQRHELAEKKMLLGRYMRWRAVPRPLMMSIRQHLLFLWDANEGYDAYEELIKDQLPPVLKAELCHHIYGKILNSAPFFGWLKDYPICTKYLCERVRSIFLEKGDHIFRMGQRNEQIYMLLTGKVLASRNESLHEKSAMRPAKNGAQMMGRISSTETPLTFDIPRRKTQGWPDVQQVKDAMMHKKHKSPTELEQSPTSAKSPASSASQYGAKKTGFDHQFDSDVLLMAHIELRREDVRRHTAAKIVQRLWRARHYNTSTYRPEAEGQGSRQKGLKISRMRSRHISAPAYFGESCLWQPVEQWDTPPAYLYSVRCESRGEIIFIPREAILDCFERFAPWLQERHEVFSRAVTGRMRDRFQVDDTLRDWVRDFAMADLEMPGFDDTALQARHTQALGRDLGHKSLDSEPLGRDLENMQRGRSTETFPRMSSTHALGGLQRGRSGAGLGAAQAVPSRKF